MCILLLLRCCTTDNPRTAESPRRRRSAPPLLVMQQIWSILVLFLAFLNETFLPLTCWVDNLVFLWIFLPGLYQRIQDGSEASIHSTKCRRMNRTLAWDDA